MDDIVKQAMAKWPNVPHAYGWLGLDARGNWYLRDAEVQALGAVREHIKSQVAQASLGAELQSSDLDTRLAKLRQSSGSVTAKAQLDAMKQARAAAAQAPVKTL